MLLYHSLAVGLSLVSFSSAQAAAAQAAAAAQQAAGQAAAVPAAGAALGGAAGGAAAASVTPAAAATAAANPGSGDIIGTWSTKSNKTLTGPVCGPGTALMPVVLTITAGLLRSYQR